MITITIDRGLDEPVYAQVAHQVRDLIAIGGLLPGTVLPSVRRLARDLGVNLNTVARAYRVLEDEGFLEIRDRAGVTVAAPAREVEEETRGRLLEELRRTLARLRQAGVPPDELARIVWQEVMDLGASGMEDRDE